MFILLFFRIILLYFQLQMPRKLGVNGYAFIVTNNGYILIHPDHRTQFKKILKPTFNRVDFVEVEILDDDKDPRMFGDLIVKLREKLINQNESSTIALNVKYSLHDMKRLMLARRHYFYAAVGPFTLGIVLPDKYGFVKIQKGESQLNSYYPLLTTNWKVHRDWVYCKSCRSGTPEAKVQEAFGKHEKSDLLDSLFHDITNTSWFNSKIENEDKFISEFHVHKVFLATHSGLFRWKTLKDVFENDFESFEDRNSDAIDEDWYRRAVEINFNDENIFIYSVPFQTSGYEDNNMITSTKAIFVEKGDLKTPVAVVGLQFNHRAMYELYNVTTKKCLDGKDCGYTCESDYLNCFILDNNAYIVLSDEPEFIGRYMGDIRPYIMSRLTEEQIYIQKRMFDYQAICQKKPPESPEKEVVYKGTKGDTLIFEKLGINKTVPTPCDHEMWLYNLNESKTFPQDPFNKTTTKFECDWPFVVDRIPNTNLLFLAINGDGSCSRSDIDHKSPEPTEIVYSEDKNATDKNDLPCYIATMNNYTRRRYMECKNKDERELQLLGNPFYCGHYWK